MTFAIKVPVSALKENRQYLLGGDRSSLSFRRLRRQDRCEDKVLIPSLALLKRSLTAFQGLF